MFLRRLYCFGSENGFFKFGWMPFQLNYSVIDGERWIMLWNRYSENRRGIFHFLLTSVFSLFCVFSFHNKTRRWQLYLNRARRPTLKKAEAMVPWNTTQNIRHRLRWKAFLIRKLLTAFSPRLGKDYFVHLACLNFGLRVNMPIFSRLLLHSPTKFISIIK